MVGVGAEMYKRNFRTKGRTEGIEACRSVTELGGEGNEKNGRDEGSNGHN